MIVKNILDIKGREVLSIRETDSVKALVDFLGKNKIGALVVVDDWGQLVGIVSERDVVKHLASTGISLLEKVIKSIMTAKPDTCSEADTVDHVMGKMTAGRFRHMPVVGSGGLVGMISIGDVVKTKIELAEAEKDALIDYMHH